MSDTPKRAKNTNTWLSPQRIRVLLCFLVVFGIATFGLTRVMVKYGVGSIWEIPIFHGSQANDPSDPLKPDDPALPVNNTDDPTEDDSRISEELTPIVVDENSPFYSAFKDQDRVNVLVLGLNDGLTDTIMVGSYDMEFQSVDIVTIPRDTYYKRSGIKSPALYKMNSIYGTRKNVKDTITAVSNILDGMPIHYYALVDFEDVREVMKVIGGVEVNIPFHMRYIDTTPGHELYIDIPAGLQTIDDKNAVEFLRFRKSNYKGYKSYSEGDVQRSEVQREFVTKVIEKCLKLKNLPEIVKVVLENVESDVNLGIMLRVAAKAMTGLKIENVRTNIIPGSARTDPNLDNLSFYYPDEKGIADLLKKVYRIEDEAAPAQ
jgi:LCP family protein required for cell wall assembly